ncbi:MAG: pyruvate, phosphate dikinase [Dehalococcoidia bacterium]
MANIYLFTEGIEDRSLLGNKGANLVTITRLGLPAPPGFVLSLEAYRGYRQSSQLPVEEIERALSSLEERVGKKLGQGLFVSVRSSAAVSMPGMMDTVLNIGDKEAMLSAARKVFESWDNPRAELYRSLNNIPPDLGTAAIVQAMVFGNLDENSGTGVVFTRNPSTGERVLFGEYLAQAQGEDLVSGVRTPAPVAALQSEMPGVYAELEEMARTLEKHFRDMQDIEFTVEAGKLYILQTRSGKRSGQAAVKIAVDMAKEGLLSQEEALLRVSPEDLKALLHKRLKSPEQAEPLTQGLNASPGAASGKVLFDPSEVGRWAKKDEKIILVRPETIPDDIQGMAAAEGVLTSRGGLTSHAAIVTRAMGKPCICGAEEVEVDLEGERFVVGDQVVRKGDEITIDGSSGNIYLGTLPLIEAEFTPELGELLAWADNVKRLGVRANVDTVQGIVLAKRFGAEGVGLCRTERQFNAPERLSVIREFILAETPEEKQGAIDRLEELQRQDFVAMFRELEGLPIIIRLLDLPLHEFLPLGSVAESPRMMERVSELQEVNPMLGHRGVRLGITSPEIYQMQIEAVEAARAEVEADVSVMIPQVITVEELLSIKRLIKDTSLKFGTMMETVRACMEADKLAEVADFFSFGTNDLTQAVYSFSREDAEKKFLSIYLEKGILEDNPFEVIDEKGVGRLMETTIFWARKGWPSLEVGVCGEHGGEPRSIKFFHGIGVDYVSCSPFRVPVAKLVAAQAVLEEKARKRAGQKDMPR